MYEIKPQDVELLKEFKEKELKDFSLELRRLLNRLRMEPLAGKVVIVATVPYREWRLARMGQKRGEPVTFLDDRVFTRLKDAEWELLKIRWRIHTGNDVPAHLA